MFMYYQSEFNTGKNWKICFLQIKWCVLFSPPPTTGHQKTPRDVLLSTSVSPDSCLCCRPSAPSLIFSWFGFPFPLIFFNFLKSIIGLEDSSVHESSYCTSTKTWVQVPSPHANGGALPTLTPTFWEVGAARMTACHSFSKHRERLSQRNRNSWGSRDSGTPGSSVHDTMILCQWFILYAKSSKQNKHYTHSNVIYNIILHQI